MGDGGRTHCSIRGWRIFPPGFHKGERYSPERCAQIVKNFNDFADIQEAPGNLGHDLKEQYSESLGFLGFGAIARMRQAPDGGIVVDVHEIPAQIGAAWNAKLLRAGSLELNEVDPPDGRPKRPDVVTGFAFLGNEPPGAKGRTNHPPAVFDDGTEVPPEHDLRKWIEAMAKVMTTLAARRRPTGPRKKVYRPQPALAFSAWAKKFSEARPMDPRLEQLTAAGFSPEEAEKMLAAIGGGAGQELAPPGGQQMADKFAVGDGTSANQEGQTRAMYAKDPDDHRTETRFSAEMTPEETQMFAAMEGSDDPNMQMMAGLCKKLYSGMGAMGKEMDAMRAEKGQQMAARFSARVKADVEQAVLDNRLLRRDLADKIDDGVAILCGRSKKFSAGLKAADPEAQYARFVTDLRTRPFVVSQDQLPADVDKPKPGPRGTPLLAGMLRPGGLIETYAGPKRAAEARKYAGVA